MYKIAVLSDIHANLHALEAVLDDIQKWGFDSILCTGDLVGYGPWPDETVALIRQMKIPTVMGNYDEAVGFRLPVCGCHINDPSQKRLSDHALKWAIEHTTPETREYLRSLPEEFTQTIENHRILMVHASVDSLNEYVYEADSERMGDIAAGLKADIYIYGHTHFPYVKTIDQRMVINAGSVGRPKQGDIRAGYMALEIAEGDVQAHLCKVAYDVDKTASDMLSRGIDPAFSLFLSHGGDVDHIAVSGQSKAGCCMLPSGHDTTKQQ